MFRGKSPDARLGSTDAAADTLGDRFTKRERTDLPNLIAQQNRDNPRLSESEKNPRKPWPWKRTPREQRSWQYRATTFALYWGFVCAIWLALILVGMVTVYSLISPDPLKAGLSQNPAKLTILAANGKVIAEKGLRRNHVPLDQMPAHVVNAVLATEDRRFYYHFGFDPLGILRATIANHRAGRIVQGGSTITQQLTKVLFLKPKRTYWRKFEEMLLAFSLEYRLEKEQILELYLNRIYFGAGNYGIEAAAQHYFGKSISDVSIYEGAILAGLIKSPSYYAPTRNLQRALDRGKLVLRKMLNTSSLSREAYLLAIDDPPILRTYLPSESFGYVIDWVVELVAAYGQNLKEDIVVETTIDYDLQGAAQRIVKEDMALHAATYSAGQAAAVILDRNGEVKALVGGRDYTKSPFNRAVKARRQPGSTFKPFVYLAAMEKGLTPASIVYDGPITVENWSPKNYNNRYLGDVTLLKGLAHSLNTVSVRLTEWVGRDTVVKTAHRLGIGSKLHHNPSISLGTAEVSPLEITAAYVPFANGGYGVLAHVIKQIRGVQGQVLFKRGRPRWGRVVKPYLVSAMNDMLSATVAIGTARQAALDPHPAAGKTGTGQDYRDAWFIGYTAHYIAGVWIGNDDFSPMKRVTGGSLPTMIWRDLMIYAHTNKEPTALPGRNWQQVGSWVPKERRSFWNSLFGGSSNRDALLGGSSPSRGGRSDSQSWTKDVFKTD